MLKPTKTAIKLIMRFSEWRLKNNNLRIEFFKIKLCFSKLGKPLELQTLNKAQKILFQVVFSWQTRSVKTSEAPERALEIRAIFSRPIKYLN